MFSIPITPLHGALMTLGARILRKEDIVLDVETLRKIKSKTDRAKNLVKKIDFENPEGFVDILDTYLEKKIKEKTKQQLKGTPATLADKFLNEKDIVDGRWARKPVGSTGHPLIKTLQHHPDPDVDDCTTSNFQSNKTHPVISVIPEFSRDDDDYDLVKYEYGKNLTFFRVKKESESFSISTNEKLWVRVDNRESSTPGRGTLTRQQRQFIWDEAANEFLLFNPTLQSERDDDPDRAGLRFLSSNKVDIDEDEQVLDENGDVIHYRGPLEKEIPYIRKFHEANDPRTFMLWGPPGTGKTSFCRQIASKFNYRFLILDPHALVTTSTRYLADTISLANPDIIVIDDFDSIWHGRDLEDKGPLEPLAEINYEIEATLLLTVNHIDRMPPAIKRPGRVDRIIRADDGNKQERRRTQRFLERKVGVDVPEQLWPVIDDVHQSYSAAHVEFVFDQARVIGWDDWSIFEFKHQ